MSQPTAYTRQFDFTGYAEDHPTVPLPGVSVDAELDAAKVTIDGLLRNIALIQRDDGALKNNIVTLDSLSSAVTLVLGASSQWTPRGAWVTATAYAVSDVVQSGTVSLVCAQAHTSAGSIDTDIAAGKWIVLFDSAGAEPADSSVTAAKLAPGAVGDEAIGFTSLDLLGSIKGRGGISAGTAPAGSLMHAKADTGNVFIKSERTTDAQGAVGYQIIGVTVTWTIKQATGDEALSLSCSALGASSTIFGAAGYLNQVGHLLSSGSAAPSAGAGAALYYSSSVGYLDAYDWTASAWKNLKIRGSEVYLSGGGVDILKVTSTGADFIAGTLKKGGIDVGYLGLPLNTQSAAYTLALSDRGKMVYSQNVAGQTITIPAEASVAFPNESVVVILNDGTNPITISASGITLKQAGTSNTGNRTLAVNGVATLVKVGTDRWFISGPGLS